MVSTIYGISATVSGFFYLLNRKKDIGRMWLLPLTLGYLLCFFLSLILNLVAS